MRRIGAHGSSFAEIRDSNGCYVDKTMLIADILSKNDRGVYLFTRPRRFGKTTNLTMLDAFFNLKYKGNAWFDELEISKHREFDKYRNASPVIFINLKEAKTSDYETFIKRIRSALYNAFDEHRYLLESDLVHPDEKTQFQDVLDRRMDEAFLRDCIPLLSKLLERYHRKTAVLLIDEYDRAVSDAFGNESQRPMMDFLEDFLNAALKNNDSLQMAYVTGVMQIANESIFPDLNNITVNNIFTKDSEERFGFTESEVKDLFSEYGRPERFEEAKQWYDGYRLGNAEVYNPYSVMCYIAKGFVPDRYWSHPGGDIILRRLLNRIGYSNFTQVLGLLNGESIVTRLKGALIYSRMETKDVPTYSLMVMSGYLKAVPTEDGLYIVSIPNKEVKQMVDELMAYINPINRECFAKFTRAALDHDAEKMASILRAILLDGSYLNLSIENAYGIVLMMILHSLHKRYETRTEYDAGNGRTDLILKPRHEGDVPMIFELKRVHAEKDLDKGLEEAIGQIHEKRYYDGMPGKVVLIGMSFFVKTPKVRVDVIDNGPDGFGYSRSHPAV